MCGIAGYYGKDRLNEDVIISCLNLMKTRGPDNQSYKTLVFKNKITCTLLHSRLSIIDLDERSNQPFVFNNFVLSYNGEIYNYREIRKELEKRGYNFETNSDTEVLIKSYHCFGVNAFDRFEGMWALALFNTETGELLLSRDRFAEKPLYFIETSKGIYFASEIKYLVKLFPDQLNLNLNQFSRYIVNGYKSIYKKHETFYNEIKEIEFSTNIIFNPQLKKYESKYWILKSDIDNSITREEAINEINKLITHSLDIRLRSDVPVAFCLSGGIDSASLASLAVKKLNQKIHTYSIIDEDERYNEYDNISATIKDLNCDHSFIKLSDTNTSLERLKKLIEYHDAPIATISYLIHSLLSEKISKDGFKVCISGTGADELLTGYYDHFNLQLYSLRNSVYFKQKYIEWKEHISNLVRNPYLKNPNLYIENKNFRDHIFLNNKEFSKYLNYNFFENFNEIEYSKNLLHNRMMNELFHEGSRVIVHEDDLNSMMNSIENRSPYLDRRLAEFSYRIPIHLLIEKGYGKNLLRESMKYILNDQVRLDRKKKGFNASITSLFDFQDKNVKEQLMEPNSFFDFVNRDLFLNLLNKKKYPNSESKLLFNLINFKLFINGQQ